jgi:hypothetical protein
VTFISLQRVKPSERYSRIAALLAALVCRNGAIAAGCAEAVALKSAGLKLDCPEMLEPTPRGFANMLRYG